MVNAEIRISCILFFAKPSLRIGTLIFLIANFCYVAAHKSEPEQQKLIQKCKSELKIDLSLNMFPAGFRD